MKNYLSLLLLFVLCSVKGFSQITVSISKPTPYHTTSTILAVIADVTSTYELNSVTATVGTKSIPLKKGSGNSYSGNFSLVTFQEGDTLTLTITAKDVYNNVQTATTPFIYDRYPQVTMVQPLLNFVATPTINFKVKNDDIDTCNFTIYIHAPQQNSDNYGDYLLYVGKIKDSIEGSLDLSPYKDSSSYLKFQVTDKRGQIWNNNVYYNLITSANSPNLHLIYKGPKNIFDFKDSLILSASWSNEGYKEPIIINIKTNKETLIPIGDSIIWDEKLTDYGAMINAGRGVYNSLIDFNNGSVLPVGLVSFSTFMQAKNKSAAWKKDTSALTSYAFSVYYRNLTTKQNVYIYDGKSLLNSFNLANNGLLVLDTYPPLTYYQNKISVYKEGIFQRSFDGNFPKTDGNNIVYQSNKYDTLYIDNGIKRTLISTRIYSQSYLINNSNIAYLRQDLAYNPQINLRDSAGKITELTHYGTNTHLGLNNLNAKGEIMFLLPSSSDFYQGVPQLYFISKDGIIKNVWKTQSAEFRTYYFDSTWYVVVGNAIYKIDLDIVLPLQLLSFNAKHNGKTNVLNWSTAQELNTDRFEIQRSSNSSDFNRIGNIKSFNNGKAKNDYVFTDAQPLKVTNYYRLKMYDKDGKFTYSDIKSLNNNGSFDITIYPNPAHGNLTLNINTEKETSAQITITNAAGKTLYTNKIQLPYGASMQNINIAALSSGNYFLKCVTADGQTVLKFVKQ